MIEDAKKRIRKREQLNPSDYDMDAKFSWRGFVIAMGTLLAFSLVAWLTILVGIG